MAIATKNLNNCNLDHLTYNKLSSIEKANSDCSSETIRRFIQNFFDEVYSGLPAEEKALIPHLAVWLPHRHGRLEQCFIMLESEQNTSDQNTSEWITEAKAINAIKEGVQAKNWISLEGV